mmetsp:Transcript_71023/g.156710  ORF Transcript_71023/g.156710 Transcript_71023/m.156710 type:complete len:182 (+) Transcript_71023:45-590(+)
MESRLPSWVLKAAVASLGAVAVVALLRKYQSKAKEVPSSSRKPVEAPVRTQPPPEEVALQAAKAAGLTGLAAQKAAALEVSGKPPGGADLNLSIEEDIKRRLKAKYSPEYLDVEDQGNNCGASKVAVVMVSAAFCGKSRINRQREVQALLREDLDTGRLHALSLRLNTPEEYQKLTQNQGK